MHVYICMCIYVHVYINMYVTNTALHGCYCGVCVLSYRFRACGVCSELTACVLLCSELVC